MIVFKNGSYQINPKNPDTNYLADFDCEQPKWVVPDNSELAGKIMSTPLWEPVTDNDGNLIDITPVELPEAEPTAEEQIAVLKSQLSDIDLQTVRPMRAITAGTATEEDRAILAGLEAQAEGLRVQIAAISAEVENERR